MAKKYLTEDNIKNILGGIKAKIPKELEVSINTNVNRTEIDILDSPTIILNYGTFGEATAVLTRDWTDFDMLEIDTEYSVPGGSAYYDTFMVSTKALNNSAILSTSSPSKFCTTIHCTNAAIGDANTTTSNLKYYYKATIVSYSDTATQLKFMGSVGSTGSVTGTTITILAIRGINYTQSCGDTPLGTIINYMGIIPPDEYLACDGTTYLISQYWELAEFIKSQFGTYNYFGGNGTTTFAVPDLRGEFLRMTGINSHTNQGNGASVGTHQDGTDHLWDYVSTSGAFGFRNETQSESTAKNVDSMLSSQNNVKYTDYAGAWKNSSGVDYAYTSRPTNTSVLYCIKYTNSSSMQPSNVYSTTEKRIGTWIDGKPLYQITYSTTTPSTLNTSTELVSLPTNVNATNVVELKYMFYTIYDDAMPTSYYYDSNSRCTIWIRSNRKITCVVSSSNYTNTNLYITIQYTKTTD